MANNKKERTVPGPKPEHVHIEGDWEDAVKKALKKSPPPKSGSAKADKKRPPTDGRS
jgi:hypothetical protein